MSFISVSFNFGLSPQTRLSCRKPFISRSSPGFVNIRAVQENGGPRRLVDIIRLVPDISRNYFRSPSRRALFGGISLLGGFYVAQTISLSFGALGVNDVIASVICVLLTEYVTRFYYSRPKVTFPIALLNNFKMGFTYGLFIDAFKLASWLYLVYFDTFRVYKLCEFPNFFGIHFYLFFPHMLVNLTRTPNDLMYYITLLVLLWS